MSQSPILGDSSVCLNCQNHHQGRQAVLTLKVAFHPLTMAWLEDGDRPKTFPIPSAEYEQPYRTKIRPYVIYGVRLCESVCVCVRLCAFVCVCVIYGVRLCEFMCVCVRLCAFV